MPALSIRAHIDPAGRDSGRRRQGHPLPELGLRTSAPRGGPAIRVLPVLCGVLMLGAVAMVARGPRLRAPEDLPARGADRSPGHLLPGGPRRRQRGERPGPLPAFRASPEGLKQFLTSLDKTTGDLAADNVILDQDDIDSVELPWKIGTKGHLAGLYVDIPEQGDRAGAARVTVDETDASAPLV